jgi:hypothetical protein
MVAKRLRNELVQVAGAFPCHWWRDEPGLIDAVHTPFHEVRRLLSNSFDAKIPKAVKLGIKSVGHGFSKLAQFLPVD